MQSPHTPQPPPRPPSAPPGHGRSSDASGSASPRRTRFGSASTLAKQNDKTYRNNVTSRLRQQRNSQVHQLQQQKHQRHVQKQQQQHAKEPQPLHWKTRPFVWNGDFINFNREDDEEDERLDLEAFADSGVECSSHGEVSSVAKQGGGFSSVPSSQSRGRPLSSSTTSSGCGSCRGLEMDVKASKEIIRGLSTERSVMEKRIEKLESAIERLSDNASRQSRGVGPASLAGGGDANGGGKPGASIKSNGDANQSVTSPNRQTNSVNGKSENKVHFVDVEVAARDSPVGVCKDSTTKVPNKKQNVGYSKSSTTASTARSSKSATTASAATASSSSTALSQEEILSGFASIKSEFEEIKAGLRASTSESEGGSPSALNASPSDSRASASPESASKSAAVASHPDFDSTTPLRDHTRVYAETKPLLIKIQSLQVEIHLSSLEKRGWKQTPTFI